MSVSSIRTTFVIMAECGPSHCFPKIGSIFWFALLISIQVGTWSMIPYISIFDVFSFRYWRYDSTWDFQSASTLSNVPEWKYMLHTMDWFAFKISEQNDTALTLFAFKENWIDEHSFASISRFVGVIFSTMEV